jgi:hypothetical protein
MAQAGKTPMHVAEGQGHADCVAAMKVSQHTHHSTPCPARNDRRPFFWRRLLVSFATMYNKVASPPSRRPSLARTLSEATIAAMRPSAQRSDSLTRIKKCEQAAGIESKGKPSLKARLKTLLHAQNVDGLARTTSISDGIAAVEVIFAAGS